MIDADTRTQLLRYATIGLASNLLLYLAYLGLTIFGLGHKTAMTLLYVSGVLVTFAANRRWSFGHRGLARAAFVRYVIAYILGYLLNLALLWIAVDRLHLPHQGVQAVAIVLVAINLFFMHKYWVFASEIRNGAA
ncbi:MAG: GtrA family protein [Gallionellaceae bacterium]|nr:GtrA family protein [Gallionellaceae bacterium]